jgi:hypothetical protein
LKGVNGKLEASETSSFHKYPPRGPIPEGEGEAPGPPYGRAPPTTMRTA